MAKKPTPDRLLKPIYELSTRRDGLVNVWAKFDIRWRGIPEWVVVNVSPNWAAGMVYIEQSNRNGKPLVNDYVDA